jgi:hypothetical protein
LSSGEKGPPFSVPVEQSSRVTYGIGLVTYGIAARWGEGGILLEPSVGSVPFDTETEAWQAAYRELASWIETGRGAARDQQRMLLLQEVKEREREWGLFG